MADITTHTVFIALGTNLGDRRANLSAALHRLEPEVQVQETSPVYETPPWGYLDQPAFLNQVLRGGTQLSPIDLLRHLKAIEADLGRVKTIQDGPRLIDLDLLFYDDCILHTEALSIPHPRLRGRAFVLVPLADLAPELRHPIYNLSVRELLAESDPSGIRRFDPPIDAGPSNAAEPSRKTNPTKR